FIIGACIPRTDFGQLGQLPHLIEHYNIHQEEMAREGSRISIGEFLYIHFIAGDDHAHPDEEEHQSLPLYSTTGGMLLFTKSTFDMAAPLPVSTQKTVVSFYASVLPLDFIFKIFHPPRLLR
ncbi:MAG: hypothetical protein AAFR14_13220, partial [Bacteroidota bacterium]